MRPIIFAWQRNLETMDNIHSRLVISKALDRSIKIMYRFSFCSWYFFQLRIKIVSRRFGKYLWRHFPEESSNYTLTTSTKTTSMRQYNRHHFTEADLARLQLDIISAIVKQRACHASWLTGFISSVRQSVPSITFINDDGPRHLKRPPEIIRILPLPPQTKSDHCVR